MGSVRSRPIRGTGGGAVRCCSAQRAQTGETRVLIDTSPDLREQMLATGRRQLDAVLFTHEHADHTHGIDELRAFYLRQRQRVPIWADETTGSLADQPFRLLLLYGAGKRLSADPQPQPDRRRDRRSRSRGRGARSPLLPFVVDHGNIDALGFPHRQCGLYARSQRHSGCRASSALSGLDLWIVDALRPIPHPSHFSLAETLAWIERLKPKRAVLTNMHIDLDYDTLKRRASRYQSNRPMTE